MNRATINITKWKYFSRSFEYIVAKYYVLTVKFSILQINNKLILIFCIIILEL